MILFFGGGCMISAVFKILYHTGQAQEKKKFDLGNFSSSSSLFTFHMNELPQELLPLIVQHLEKQDDRYTCTLINKRFYQAANPLLWETANLFCNEPAQAF
ncbi:unnamed protein product [Absidia cylindrospora]